MYQKIPYLKDNETREDAIDKCFDALEFKDEYLGVLL